MNAARRPELLLILGAVLLPIGVASYPLLTTVGIGLIGLSMVPRPGGKVEGYSLLAAAVVMLVIQVAYGLGKDAAMRDNALRVSMSNAGK